MWACNMRLSASRMSWSSAQDCEAAMHGPSYLQIKAAVGHLLSRQLQWLLTLSSTHCRKCQKRPLHCMIDHSQAIDKVSNREVVLKVYEQGELCAMRAAQVGWALPRHFLCMRLFFNEGMLRSACACCLLMAPCAACLMLILGSGALLKH